jgi:molybdopterin molybdotransferase
MAAMSLSPAEKLDDARRRILDAVPALQPIELPLQEAYGCVAASEVATEYDIPPFSAAETEGVAARAADIVGASSSAPVSLRLAGWALAGRPPEVTVGWGEAVRVVAGAPVPAGADCVLPAGRFVVDGESVRVLEEIEPGTSIRPAGEDLKAGAVLVPAGRRLSAAELGILATAGHGTVVAYPKVRVGVFAVGELVEPGRPTSFGQVRDANSYLLLGALRDVGAVPYRIGIVTDPAAQLRETVMSNTLRADAFVAAGGSFDQEEQSMELALAGTGDVRPYRVAMYPGSVLGFGLVEGKPFFSLSGSPMSAFVAFEVFVRPAVLGMMGRRDVGRPEVRAVLDEPVRGPSDVELFVPARVAHRDGAWHVRPTGAASEGMLGSVVQANGLVAVPPGESPAPGTEVRVQILRPLER